MTFRELIEQNEREIASARRPGKGSCGGAPGTTVGIPFAAQIGLKLTF